MKVLKKIAFSLSVLIFIVLVGCSKDILKTGSLKNKDMHTKVDDNIINNDGTNEFEFIIPNNIECTIKYTRTESDLIKQGLTRIDTYEDYLKVKDLIDVYDEEFFNVSSLILYGQTEGSGSVKVDISSVSFKENVITVEVTTSRPIVGTCDMAYHMFVIEYEKPEAAVNEIKIKHK